MEAGKEGVDLVAQRDALINAVRHERRVSTVLANRLRAAEDAIVDRDLADFEPVLTDETREYWRDQLMVNRQMARVALTQAVRMAGGNPPPTPPGRGAGSDGGTRRPLHNRALSRPVVPGGGTVAREAGAGRAAAAVTDEAAGKLRNRAHEIAKAEGIPFLSAFRRAEREMGGKG